MAIVTDTVAVQRFAMGLFGVQVGSVTMAQVDKQIDRTSLGATLNSYFASGFGGQTTAAVAATLVKNLGITGAGVDGAVAYVTGALNAAAPAARGEAISNIINLFSGLTADATYGAAAQAWNANVDVAAAYTGAANTAFGSVIHHSLTSGMDTLFGSALADVFTADLSSGGNTLQGGDSIDGGAGADTLHAFLGSNSDGFAITAKTANVENVIVQAQSRSYESGDNNVANEDLVDVDGGRMSGVNSWENNNSRADLIIEDVRIADNQITKDITITMRETDPGNVDFGVYFDQNSLRNTSASTSQINLQVMDTRAVVDGKDPLLNSPYGGFKFTATDAAGKSTVVTLQSDAIDAAQTYEALAIAFQAAADKQFGAGVVTVSVGNTFSVTDTTTAQTVNGKEVIIKTSSSFTFTTPAGSGWVAAGVVPANSGLHTNFSQGSTTSTDLVTSTIVLDDVGRGSTGGDLVVGGLSVGETSTSKGVQRFNITVEDNSKLQTINSTNDTLREVSIVNGTTTRVNNAYNDNVKDAGNLTVTGNVNAVFGAGTDNLLPGLTVAQHGKYGFNDVKLIDASTFKGKLDLDAVLTANATTKYMTLNDASPAAPAADNVAFTYNLGTNDDKFALDIDASNLNSAGTTTREDFVLSINGGAGKDTITANILNGGTEDGSAAWYNNSKLNANLSINGGAGDDTVNAMGAGDWKITGGDGNDTVYSDNSGASKGVWVLNAVNAGSNNNYVSDANDSYKLFKSSISVTYRGITSTNVAVSNTDYKTSDLQINQAVKTAINSDPVLSKLLKATDGPANTLVITSLTDGDVAFGSLTVTSTAPVATDLTVAETAAAAAAYGLVVGSTSAQVVLAMTQPTIATYNNLQSVVGSDSNQATDSTHNLGNGNDVLVLSTNDSWNGLLTDAKVYTASNEKVVYDAVDFGNDTIVNFGAGANVASVFATFTTTVASPPAAAGTYIVDGVTVNVAAGLASVGLVAAAIVAQYNAAPVTNFVASNVGDVVTFTAKQEGPVVLPVAGGTVAVADVPVLAAGVAPVVGVGSDVLDFTALGGRSAGFAAALNTDGGINVAAEVVGVNDTAALVKGLFADDAVANKGIFVVVNATNIGTVYQVIDGAAATDLTVTAIGTIDLADTPWGSLTPVNFA